jgi:hypothetical protein
MLLLEVCGLAVPRSCGDARELHGLALAVDDDLRVVGELIAVSFSYDTVLIDEAGPMRRAQSLTRVLPQEKDRQTLGIQVSWIFLPVSATRQSGIPDAPLKDTARFSLP